MLFRSSLDPNSLQSFLVWVKFPNLDLQFWNNKMIGKIASMLGKPCYMDKLTASKDRLSFARVLVELKSGQKLLDAITLRDQFGSLIVQKVEYEFRSLQCFQCYKFGHVVKNCPVKVRAAWVPTGSTTPAPSEQAQQKPAAVEPPVGNSFPNPVYVDDILLDSGDVNLLPAEKRSSCPRSRLLSRLKQSTQS